MEDGSARMFHGALVGRTDEGERFNSRYMLNSAQSLYRQEKEAIGRRAATLISEQDTAVIDAGSTTEFLAENVSTTSRATIICYSINVFLRAAKQSEGRLILAGGEYHRDSKMFRGSGTVALLQTMRATKAFVSAGGVSNQLGVTCSNQFEYDMKRTLMDYSMERILLVDHSKFDYAKNYHFGELSEFDILVTDRELEPEYSRYCRENDVTVMVAHEEEP